MTSTKKIEAPWLLAPEWKDFPMTKGLNHHRIPVGIILAANEDITIKLASETLDTVTVQLLNNDNQTESTFIIENSLPYRSAVIGSESLTVPFIDCDYLEEPPTGGRVLEVEYPTTSKVLPTYRYGDDEFEFFELWDSQEAEFAYIESDKFSLLIPEIDKENARCLPDDNHLDDLILFYDEVFTIFNYLIGLSFDETGTNANVRNRFFLKADKSGCGSAYYGESCTAESTESVTEFWLDLSPTNWGALHEIGHGHELKSLSDETFSINEVWNNVLVVFYQYIMMGDEILTKGGLSRESTKIQSHLDDGEPLKEWGLFEKLSFLIHMFLKAGFKSFTRFNVLTRREYAGKSPYASGSSILEKLMNMFSMDFKLDVYPFMKLAKGIISDTQLLEHYYSFSEVAYPLSYLISDEDLLDNVKSDFNLWYYTSLVTPLDLRRTNLKSEITLEIDKGTFPVLFGQVLKLIDGSRTVAEKRILQQTIVFKNIPIGVYRIFIQPNFLNNQFVFDNFYAVVHANEPQTVFVSSKKIKNSSLLLDKIKFLGLGEEHFATLSVDLLKSVLQLNVFAEEPHSYYADEVYASVTIKTCANTVILSKALKGTKCNIGLHEIPLKETLIIEIFHAETKIRLKTEDLQTNDVINRDNNTNVLLVSKFGFQNKYAPKEITAKRFLRKIDKAARKIRDHPFLYNSPYCHPKYDLFLAIEGYKRLFHRYISDCNLEDQFKDCLPPERSVVDLEALVDLSRSSKKELLGDDSFYVVTQTKNDKKHILLNKNSSFLSVKLEFLGLSDERVSDLYIDSLKGVIKFNLLSPNPHEFFKKEAYCGLTVRSKNGDVIFNKIIKGIDESVGEFEIPISMDIELEIFHAETPTRLISTNPVTSSMIDRESNINTWTISKHSKLKRNKRYHLNKNSLLRTMRNVFPRSKSFDNLYAYKTVSQN